MIKTILVAVDFSECSLAALAKAVEVARATSAELSLLHADEFPLMLAGEMPYLPPNVLAEHDAALRERLERLVEDTKKQGVRVRGGIAQGAAAQAILDGAKVEGADLIVMGTHGLRGFRHLIAGSVAERIARTSPIPVLSVRLAPPASTPSASKT